MSQNFWGEMTHGYCDKSSTSIAVIGPPSEYNLRYC